MESGFSDFNPFQSGGEESPEKRELERKKKRQVSLNAANAAFPLFLDGGCPIKCWWADSF